MEVITECVVQTIVYRSYIKCDECQLYIEPRTKCVRLTCSCNCGSVIQLCNCCFTVGKLLLVCGREKEEEEREAFIDQICREMSFLTLAIPQLK